MFSQMPSLFGVGWGTAPAEIAFVAPEAREFRDIEEEFHGSYKTRRKSSTVNPRLRSRLWRLETMAALWRCSRPARSGVGICRSLSGQPAAAGGGVQRRDGLIWERDASGQRSRMYRQTRGAPAGLCLECPDGHAVRKRRSAGNDRQPHVQARRQSQVGSPGR